MRYKFPRYLTIIKHVGETPLQATERLRNNRDIPLDVPLAYAGRLDPMASGKLLILIGDECKRQEHYHAFDKEYEFEVLFGVSSDTGDVLGIVRAEDNPKLTKESIRHEIKNLQGSIELTYPHFSAKTVQGKPLHMWTLEGRLHEIEIPRKTSVIHKLSFVTLKHVSADTLYKTVTKKIETIPPVTDIRKELGRDFRRVDVRESWKRVYKENPSVTYPIARFHCIASSGTYMRSLAEVIASKLNTSGLAYSIHRTRIGRYHPLCGAFGMWTKKF